MTETQILIVLNRIVAEATSHDDCLIRISMLIDKIEKDNLKAMDDFLKDHLLKRRR